MTNEQRWKIAQFCGYALCECDDPECGPKCGCYQLRLHDGMIDPEDDEAGWWPSKPSVDEIARELPFFDIEDAEVVPMMEALIAADKRPRISSSGNLRVVEWLSIRHDDSAYDEWEMMMADTIPAAVAAATLACAKDHANAK